jgi:regulator of RNase E activity RraB
MKIERQRMVLLEVRTPHQLEASKLDRQLKELQQLIAKLGVQYEGARALGIEADEKLKEVRLIRTTSL